MPGPEIQTKLTLVDDDTLVTDVEGIFYEKQVSHSRPMTVGELKKRLEKEDATEFCLHKFQRKAVNKALAQPLSLIQV